MTGRAADLPSAIPPHVGPDSGAALRPLRILSLTGGGYRGLFSATVLVNLCRLAGVGASLDDRFEVFAGTSIGAVMACALAVGVTPQRVLDAIDANGPTVFEPRPMNKIKQLMAGAVYDSDRLSKAISESLGVHASRPIRSVPVALVVPAVNWSTGEAEIFMSAPLGEAHASDVSLHDVCMASAAAPTFFAPYRVEGAPMLDGGLVANNPDVLALHEVLRRWPHAADRVEMLSIGTAGAGAVRLPDEADQGALAWARKLALFMIDVQEATAATQARRLLGDRYVRLNHDAAAGELAFERLDLASDAARTALMSAGQDIAQRAYVEHRAFIDRMLSGLRAN